MLKYIPIILSLLLGTAAADIPTAKDLLNKYSETQNMIRSFISKDICTEERKSAYRNQITEIETTSEFRTDGTRFSYHAQLKSEDADYNNLYWSWLWDGETFIGTQRAKTGQLANVIIRNHKEYLHNRLTEYHGAPVLGIMGNDTELITTIFHQARELSVNDQLDTVGDSKCYVVKAVTKYGRYAIWIDPEHGYNITQAKVVKGKDDIVWEKPLDPKYKSISFVLKNVRFDKIDDLWVPMEAEYEYKFVNKNGKVGKNKQHFRRIEFVLNPNHETLASFKPDNIKEGSPVYIEGKGNTKYTWHNGKVVTVDKKKAGKIKK